MLLVEVIFNPLLEAISAPGLSTLARNGVKSTLSLLFTPRLTTIGVNKPLAGCEMVTVAGEVYESNRNLIGVSPSAEDISGAANQKAVSCCPYRLDPVANMNTTKSQIRGLIADLNLGLNTFRLVVLSNKFSRKSTAIYSNLSMHLLLKLTKAPFDRIKLSFFY